MLDHSKVIAQSISPEDETSQEMQYNWLLITITMEILH